jgi:hypothetical protein
MNTVFKPGILLFSALKDCYLLKFPGSTKTMLVLVAAAVVVAAKFMMALVASRCLW